MSSIPTSPYTALTPNDAGSHNTIINPLITAVNAHTHDPGDGTNGYGAAIPPWGPGAGSFYTANGPGSANWSTTFQNSAAIPADPSETVQNPSSGAGRGTYTAITASAGIAVELQRIRGQLARLTGGNWYDQVGAAVAYDAGTSNLTMTGNLSANQLISTIPSGTAPLSVVSTTKVTNLNADLLDGFTTTTTTAGQVGSGATTASTIPITDTNGFFSPGLIEYDQAEAATLDTLVSGTSSLYNSLNRIRYQIAQLNIAGGGSTWLTPPPSLVQQVISGVGTVASQVSPGIFRVDSTGAGAATSGALTYGDLFADAVTTGITPSAGTGLNLNVASGRGYVSGQLSILSTGVTVPLNASTTNYIFWDGGPNASDFVVNTTGTRPAGTIPIATAVTSASAVTSVTDKRVVGALFNGHVSMTGPKPTIAAVGNVTGTALSSDANDFRGGVSFTGSATSTAGNQVTVTFASPFPSVPYLSCDMVTNTSISANAVSVTTTGFTISMSSAPVNGTAYTIHYIAIG